MLVSEIESFAGRPCGIRELLQVGKYTVFTINPIIIDYHLDIIRLANFSLEKYIEMMSDRKRR